MTAWFIGMDRIMEFRNRKILLFQDNPGPHLEDLNLKHIHIIFLSPNVISVCHLMDESTI